MKIEIVDARKRFTKMLVAVYQEASMPTSFLRSFFKVTEEDTKELSIEVQRNGEHYAVDVSRGTEGNRNVFGKSSEKTFIPPYFREYFDATDLDFYDRLFGEGDGTISDTSMRAWLDKITKKLMMLQAKIERSYERYCAQVLQTGVLELTSGENIDFKRKAESIRDVDVTGDYWNTASGDPIADIITGVQFLRKEGQAQGGVFNAILGEGALDAMLNNAKYKERADVRNFSLDQISEPVRNSVGGVHHGRISAGSYLVDLWTYPQYFQEKNGTKTPYIDDENVILLPADPNFTFGFAAVPMVHRNPDNVEFPEMIVNTRGSYHVSSNVDDRGDKHVFDIKSAGMPIPEAVDQIYTMKVK